MIGVGEGEGDGEGDGDGEACGCGSPVCAEEPDHKEAQKGLQKAQKAKMILTIHFVPSVVLFVLLCGPFCGLISSSRRLLVSVLR